MKLKLLWVVTLFLLTSLVSRSQIAGSIDTTFIPNAGGSQFTTNGYVKAVGVEIVGNSIYYALSASGSVPKVRKYDLNGNEDMDYYTNHMSSWSQAFSTVCLEPKKDMSGNLTGEMFVRGRTFLRSFRC